MRRLFGVEDRGMVALQKARVRAEGQGYGVQVSCQTTQALYRVPMCSFICFTSENLSSPCFMPDMPLWGDVKVKRMLSLSSRGPQEKDFPSLRRIHMRDFFLGWIWKVLELPP